MKNPLTTVLPQRLRRSVPEALDTFRRLEEEMEQWFRKNPLTGDWGDEQYDYDYNFSPACNVKENSKEYLLELDIPGIKKEDLKIEIDNNQLTVSGERKDSREEKDERYFLSETSRGAFVRSISLPSAVDEDKINACYEDGLLSVRIPKLENSKAKEVKVS